MLNAPKAVEMLLDFKENLASPAPIILCSFPLNTVEFFYFLKNFNFPKSIMVNVCTAVIEYILSCSMTVQFAASTAKDKSRSQCIICLAEGVIGCNQQSLQDLHDSRTLKCGGKIMANPSHPEQKLFEKLPAGKRLHSIRTETSRHKNSFPDSCWPNQQGPVSPTDTDSGLTVYYYCVTSIQLLQCFPFTTLQVSGHISVLSIFMTTVYLYLVFCFVHCNLLLLCAPTHRKKLFLIIYFFQMKKQFTEMSWTGWCKTNNFCLNIGEIKGVIINDKCQEIAC